MASSARSIEPLGPAHDRKTFDCGNSALNDFLHKYARQNEERDLSRTFVAIDRGSPRILGYFSLRTGQAACDAFPPEETKHFPRYPLPVVHLARLAVDRSAQGQGIGRDLLVAALRLSLQVARVAGVLAVEVFAIDDAARAFYLRHGFKELRDDRRHLYLSLKTVRRLFPEEVS